MLIFILKRLLLIRENNQFPVSLKLVNVATLKTYEKRREQLLII